MNDTEFDKAVRKEKNKLKKLLKDTNISDNKRKAFEPIIENVALMRVKLDELREAVAREPFMVEYDNGGGQKGIRENPIFKRYESFFKTYMLGMGRIIDTLPDEIAVEEATTVAGFAPQSVLDKVLDKHKGIA